MVKCKVNVQDVGKEHDVSSQGHVIDLDLRLKVKRKMPKKRRALYKKREDKRYLKGRTYEDYRAFLQLHEGMSIVQMDTVYNDVAGPYL